MLVRIKKGIMPWSLFRSTPKPLDNMTTENWNDDEYITFFNNNKEIITGKAPESQKTHDGLKNYDPNNDEQKYNLQKLINDNSNKEI